MLVSPDGRSRAVLEACLQDMGFEVHAPTALLTEPDEWSLRPQAVVVADRHEVRVTRTGTRSTSTVVRQKAPYTADDVAVLVRRILRNPEFCGETGVWSVGDLVLDEGAATVRQGGRLLPLSRAEYAILRHLVLSAPAPVSRSRLLERAWPLGRKRSENLVTVHVKGLRHQLGRGHRLVVTVRSRGYAVPAATTVPPTG